VFHKSERNSDPSNFKKCIEVFPNLESTVQILQTQTNLAIDQAKVSSNNQYKLYENSFLIF
jgi:hypothetical protein